jgi:hypothetical protein
MMPQAGGLQAEPRDVSAKVAHKGKDIRRVAMQAFVTQAGEGGGQLNRLFALPA